MSSACNVGPWLTFLSSEVLCPVKSLKSTAEFYGRRFVRDNNGSSDIFPTPDLLQTVRVSISPGNKTNYDKV